MKEIFICKIINLGNIYSNVDVEELIFFINYLLISNLVILEDDFLTIQTKRSREHVSTLHAN